MVSQSSRIAMIASGAMIKAAFPIFVDDARQVKYHWPCK